MNIKEIVEEYARSCRKALAAGKMRPWYDGPSLEEANLTGADLTRAVLWDADLTDADLTRAVLSEADLSTEDVYLAKAKKGGALRRWMIENPGKMVNSPTAPKEYSLKYLWNGANFQFEDGRGIPCIIPDSWEGVPANGPWKK